jgi:ABC-2 type transport system ATP-binding protein
MMPADPAISARGVVKRFKAGRGALAAVAGVDLDVAAGTTFGLIGPDGAGKTTLTRVLLGLLARTGGQSSILGHDSMTEAYAIRERVGYISQRFALPGDLTVLENLRFFARVQGVSRAEGRRRIPELLRFAGLADFTGRLASRLSGGMKKKLALACSLIHEPQVVLLDEPTLGVDPVSRREFWNLLGDLRARKGLTIFVCTPYMDEAERCDRVGLMYKGKLLVDDTPAAIRRQVPGRLLEFAPSDLEAARTAVAGLPGLIEIQTCGSLLHVFVDDPDAGRPWIEAALAAQGIACAGLREIEPRMEEAFISLIGRQRPEA